jgi:hypothetical protein
MNASLIKKLLVVAASTTSVTFVALAGGCSSDGGSTADASNDTNVDGSMDAVVDTKPPKDTAPPDNQPMCPTPGDVSKFTPPARVPPKPTTDSCSPTQVQGYWDACRGPQATAMGCTTWKAANTTCTGCIESQRADTTWSALVMSNGITFLDVSGCIALLGDTTCAKAYQDAQLCEATACDVLCPVTDFFDPDHANTLASWQKCSQSAATTVCASYEQKVASMCAKDAGTAAGICLSFTSFQTGYFQYIPIFCSTG